MAIYSIINLRNIHVSQCIRTLIVFAGILAMSSCATYHPLAIDQHAIDSALKPPDLETVRVEAQHIVHPVLKPMTINLNDGLSPDEAAILAVLTNPGLKGIRDQKHIANAEIISAGILPNPQLSASVDVPTGSNSAGAVNAYGLQLGWDFMSLIGRKDRISAAQSEKAAVDLSVAWEEWQVAESAKLHLLHMLWEDKELSLLTRKKDEFSKNRAAMRTAVDQGQKTAVDLAASESAFRQMEQTISDVKQQREQERLALNQTLGLPPGTLIAIEEETPMEQWPVIPGNEDFFSGLPKRRPDLLALTMGYNSQEAKLRVAVLSQFPKIGIGLNLARDTGNLKTTGLGVNLEFPLFDRAQGPIAIETATRRKLYDEYMARIFDARADITAIKEKIESGRERIGITRKSLESLQHLVHIYKIALDQGNADRLTYYQAQQDLIAKQLELIQLQMTVTDLGVAFETATGIYFPIERDQNHR